MKKNASVKFSKTLLAGLCFALFAGSASADLIGDITKGLTSAGNAVASGAA